MQSQLGRSAIQCLAWYLINIREGDLVQKEEEELDEPLSSCSSNEHQHGCHVMLQDFVPVLWWLKKQTCLVAIYCGNT